MPSDTHLKFYGCWHLAGETVQVTIAGLDCGDYIVDDDGTVEVPFGADENGILTAEYVSELSGAGLDNAVEVTFILDDEDVSATIPVLVGKGYRTRGQTLRPVLANDLGLRTHGLGKTRRAHEYAVLLHYAADVSFGTNFTDMDTAQLVLADGETAWPQDSTYSGVYRGILTDGYGYDSMLCWQVDRPWPLMVCAVSVFLVAEE
ncbi:MAG: hypothetical protein AB7H90_03480 [Alphaproteobacteria bacterium]